MRNRRGFFCASAFLICCSVGIAKAQRGSPPSRDPRLPVLRARSPIEIIGTVVARDQDGGEGFGLVDVDAYLDPLVIRVEKVIQGKVTGKYVRADFVGGGDNYLPKSLFEGKPRKMRLEPVWFSPDHYKECDWTIRPSPPPGSMEIKIGPRLIAVGGASTFSDPNSLSCYAMKRQNIQ